MFTGLITAIGTIDRVRETDAGREFRVRCGYTGLVDGESIALNGACLTVREHGDGWFTVAAIVTTLERTTMAAWQEGRQLNLERALALGDRLGGHIVQGHVDHLGTVCAIARRADALVVDVSIPAPLEPLLVPQGSITVDGVSLTVNALPAPGVLQLSLIEFTWRHTTLGALAVGDRVHLEADVIAKHVHRLVAPYVGSVGATST